MFDSQSTSQIIAEIDFEVNLESHLSNSIGKEDDSKQEASPAQCFKIPETVSGAERDAHSLTHTPFRLWCFVCQRAKSATLSQVKQKAVSVFQLDHSFYKAHDEGESLKVLTIVETVTSMSGAAFFPDLSVNQVAVKALKKFTAINGVTKSVLQCDGHSGLLASRLFGGPTGHPGRTYPSGPDPL